jgi:hypothetical protein
LAFSINVPAYTAAFPRENKAAAGLEEHVQNQVKLTIYTVGPLQLLLDNGDDCTPRGRKACGVIALLAHAPGHRRSRKWIQDKLWSDRGPEQGAVSLRQTLGEIRKALGRCKDCLRADRTMVSLDPVRVVVLAQSHGQAAFQTTSARDGNVLFEGLDVVDREFEDWLRDQRQMFEDHPVSNTLADRLNDAGGNSGPPVITRGQMQLVLRDSSASCSPHDSMVSNCLTDIVAKSIAELGSVEIFDERDGSMGNGATNLTLSNQALSVVGGIARERGKATWRVVLSHIHERQILWSSAQSFAEFDLDSPDLLRECNRVVDAAFVGFRMREEQATATWLCHQGIQELLKLGKANLDAADRLFDRAFCIEPRGIYLAWRAYLRTFLLVERLATNREETTDEAIAFMHRALELEPRNSYVASFSAHVHAIVRRSYVAAFELAQRSVQLNRSNPIGWACLGMAECHLGKAAEGFQRTLVARELASASPFQYQVEGLSCIAGSIAGDIERAIWLGEASHSLAPAYKPPLRYLSVLYLLNGEEEKSQKIIQKIQVLEPGFSYDLMRDTAYPAASLQRSKLLERIPTRQI